jgi:hypothetical protein
LTAATTQAKAPRRPLRLQAIALACLVAAVAVITVERTWLALALPLWFDESFTAAVAATPNWRSFVQEAYNDVAAPLYYALMRLWEGLAGPSDFALRAPALLAILAAGAIPIASRIKGLSFEARVTWGAMIFGWWGVGVLLNGRCYALLLAVSTLQCVLFARLLVVPNRRNAWLWAGVAACAILLQYYALIAAAAQGLLYLASRRREALRTWPAVLAFAPAFGWMAFHAPRLQAFSAGDVAWHALVGPAEAVGFTAFAFNPSSPLVLPLAAAVVLAGLLAPKASSESEAAPTPTGHLWLVAGAAVAALALTLLSGALRPSLTGRYLVPVAPGLLLGLVLSPGDRPARTSPTSPSSSSTLALRCAPRPSPRHCGWACLTATSRRPRRSCATGSPMSSSSGTTRWPRSWRPPRLHGSARSSSAAPQIPRP